MKTGDVITFDYELWVEGREQLYDTTLREAAEKATILDGDAAYGPMHYVLGTGRLIPGLEKALLEAPVGTPVEVSIPPAEAYGERDAKLIETVPMQEFRKNKVEAEPGLVVSYKNRRGLIMTVGGGRVRVDFNPPLAGKSLRYRFTVRSAAQSLKDQVRGIIHMDYPNALEWDVLEETKKGVSVVTVVVPQQVPFDRNWLVAKFRILTDLRRHTKVDSVRFVEEFRIREETAPRIPVAPANSEG